MVAFACTACGSCCTRIHENWVGYEQFKADGWILPDGACKNYDRATRLCCIYETRPDACRVDVEQRLVGFPGLQETWFAYVESCCDDAHLREYGVPRERGEACSHRK